MYTGKLIKIDTPVGIHGCPYDAIPQKYLATH